jgi:hypothetical protein
MTIRKRATFGAGDHLKHATSEAGSQLNPANKHGLKDVFGQSLDGVFRKNSKHLLFYDKSGILEGGLWVLFEQSTSCVLKVLTDPQYGDTMLCINSDMSFEDMANHEPDPVDIIGFAIIPSREPENYAEYLGNHWSKIKHHLPDISGYNRAVYEYILDKLQDSTLCCKKGLTMEMGKGVVKDRGC